ncbi:hypothetical protein D3C83_258590 [compost metagenome]
MKVIAVDTVEKISSMLPPSSSVIAGAPPLYMMCCIFTPTIELKISAAMWSAWPMPEEP